MVMTDPIADMLTRIRNASRQKHATVDIPLSKLKLDITRILKESGFIMDYKVVGEGLHKNICVYLRYTNEWIPIVTGIKRVSKPGRRVYVDKDDIPMVISGIGVAILSTSKGLLTDKEARRSEMGGEILCYVW